MVLDAKGVACGKPVCDEDKTAGMREWHEVQGWREAKEPTGKSTERVYEMDCLFYSMFLSPQWGLEGGWS